MFSSLKTRIPAAILLLSPVPAFAQRTLVVGTGSSITFWGVMTNIINYLAMAISSIAVAMFVVGALMITLSGVKEDLKQKGKDFMIGSIISLGVVSGAYVILTIVDRFLS